LTDFKIMRIEVGNSNKNKFGKKCVFLNLHVNHLTTTRTRGHILHFFSILRLTSYLYLWKCSLCECQRDEWHHLRILWNDVLRRGWESQHCAWSFVTRKLALKVQFPVKLKQNMDPPHPFVLWHCLLSKLKTGDTQQLCQNFIKYLLYYLKSFSIFTVQVNLKSVP